MTAAASLGTVVRAWGRIGCLGFGGPPVHVAMLRELCVQREGWIADDEFEDAVAFCNLLPGPASSQLAILTAWRVRGRLGGLLGGLAFVLPGLVLMIGLAALFLAQAPPVWIRGAGAGAGAVVAAVALHAGWGLLLPSRRRAREAGDGRGRDDDRTADHGPAPGAGRLRRPTRERRWTLYVALGAVAAVVSGPWVVLVLVGCGAFELLRRHPAAPARGATLRLDAWPLVAGVVTAAAGVGGLGALAWTSFKVGALSYGGGFVIIPLMRADAVDRYGWMSDARFLDAVALGQVTPGPVVHTVSAVGYAAHGVGGAVFAAVIAFAPSFALILALAPRFASLRADERLRAFLDGAGPAAVGAILGAAVPLALALGEAWQAALLAAALVALLVLRRGVVPTLLGAGAVGIAVAVLGGPVPG